MYKKAGKHLKKAGNQVIIKTRREKPKRTIAC